MPYMRIKFKSAARGWLLPLATRHLPLWLGVLLLALSLGCRLVQGVADVPGQAVRTVTPGKPDKTAVDPVELQQMLLRFGDEFSARMIVGVEKLRRGTNNINPADALRWKIGFGTAISSIATGPNAVANVLDMTVFVTVTRTALEEYWQPRVFGASAQPLLDASRTAETNIWKLAETILKPEQQAELRGAIEAWYRQNPLPESILAARAVGFASQVAQTKTATASKPGSVFGLLSLDPLSSLDPAMRELAQTRLFAERALYLAHRMPMLLRWQTELLALNTTDLPAVQQLVTNSTQITASVERFAAVAEKLPEQVSAEREQIVNALQSQEKGLTTLARESRQTLEAGTELSASLNTTITTLDTVMKRFGIGETNRAGRPEPNAEPFRIQDYTDTAVQLEKTARQLTELLVTLDQTLGSTNLARFSAQARTGGKEIVNYAFWKGVLLVLIVLVAALIYRWLVARMNTTRPKSSSP